MSTTLEKDYAPGRPPVRIRLAGEPVEVKVSEVTPSVGSVTVTLDASITTLRGLGFSVVGQTPAPSGAKVYRGTWSGAASYLVDDVVKAPNGKSYKATTANQNTQPPGANWSEVTVASDLASTTILSGTGVPASSLGEDGVYFLDTQGGRLYGPKAAGAWGSGYSFGAGGNTLLNGAGAPGNGLGADGDFYIDTGATAIYGPKAAGAWGGSTSLVGPQGSQGSQGSQGNQGNQGTAGVDGKTVRSGSGAPAGGVGVDGDFYIDTTAWTIYGPKAAGAWGNPTSIVGAQGAQGNQGATGATGSASVYGSGVDGNLAFDGQATILGMVPSGNVYTMTRDIYAQDLSFSSGVTVKTGGFIPFVKGTLTFADSTCGFSWSGNSASGLTAGTAFSLVGSLAVTTQAGGAGRNTTGNGTAPGALASSVPLVKGGAGGNADGANKGGVPSTPTAPIANWGGWQALDWVLRRCRFQNGTSFTVGNYGCGGTGGGTNVGTGTATSGGGGAGGPLVVVFARYVVSTTGSGQIIAGGGKGANAAATGNGLAGGGGGGSGGVAVLVTSTPSPVVTLSAPGGSGGTAAGGGTATAGATGVNGATLLLAA